jgi:ribosome assembly protein 1
VLKTVTLSSTLDAPSFTPMHFEALPIVRVAIETTNIKDMPALKEGMRLLSLADPCVEVRGCTW